MNLYSCIKALETIAKSHPSVNETGNGSIYDFANANPSLKYACFFISQTTHKEDDYFSYYGFNLFYFDRLIDDLESNRLQIQSIGKDVLTNTLKLFIENFVGSTYSQLTFVPFTQRFTDLCAGIYVTVQLKVPKAIICSEDFEELVVFTGNCQTCYDEGYADGLSATFEDGFESGITYQKSLLISTAITENGEYSRENGYGSISVNIDTNTYYNNGYSSGYTDGYTSGNTDGYEEGYNDGLADCGSDYDEGFEDGYESGYTIGYDSGYTDGINSCEDRYDEGYESGVTDQKNKLSSISINVNGTYTNEDGYSAVTVNIPQTGYTQDDLNHYYNSGYTSGWTDGFESGITDGYNSGITYQKSLLSYSSFTENGTYTKNDGWSAITINVPQTGYTEQDIINAYNSGWTGGYNSGYTDGWNDCSGQTPTPPSPSGQTDYSTEYFTIETLSGGTINYNMNQNKNLDYSINDGEWTALEGESLVSGITVQTGDKIRFKGIHNTLFHSKFKSDCKFIVYGNIMSLIYGDNFSGQTSLETGITDPQSGHTFCELFENETNLIDAENLILPATTLVDDCYRQMFYGCSNLTTAPELPATTLSERCYDLMFRGCSSLTTAPELPATTLTQSCYYRMFASCTSLTTAPALPATTLANNCYESMFAGCYNIINVPSILPATTLTYKCYESMFYGCSNLTTAPELPATTLSERCYYEMFRGSNHLNYIKCLATNISATNCTYNWTYGVASTGTFVKDANMTGWTTDTSGIPNNWTVQDAS